MHSLREIQLSAYRAFVLEEPIAMPGLIGDALGVAAGIGVYRNNARGTFVRTLETCYPAVARLVGADCFRSLSLTYMRDFPSRSGDLGRFGGEFPLLLDIVFRDTAHAYLADTARLEWAVSEVGNTLAGPPLDPSSLAGLTPSEQAALRFRWQPAARLYGSRFPVLSIWRAQQQSIVPPLALDAGAEHMLVTRHLGDVTVEQMAPADFAFAAAVADGERLDAALEAGLAVGAEFDPGAALAGLASRALLVDFYIEN